MVNSSKNRSSKRRPVTGQAKRREMTPARATLLAGFAAAGAAVVAALITVLPPLLSNDDAPGGRTSTTAPGSPALADPSAVRARVIYTGGVGVSKFEQPTNKSGKMYGPAEGELVDLVCQVRNGQPLSDPKPAPGQPSNWPVWDKLKDGFFIPDLYTDLPKDPGPKPPRGLPVC